MTKLCVNFYTVCNIFNSVKSNSFEFQWEILHLAELAQLAVVLVVTNIRYWRRRGQKHLNSQQGAAMDKRNIHQSAVSQIVV